MRRENTYLFAIFLAMMFLVLISLTAGATLSPMSDNQDVAFNFPIDMENASSKLTYFLCILKLTPVLLSASAPLCFPPACEPTTLNESSIRSFAPYLYLIVLIVIFIIALDLLILRFCPTWHSRLLFKASKSFSPVLSSEPDPPKLNGTNGVAAQETKESQ